MSADAQTECRTPTKGRDGVTRIPTWKYTPVRRAILEILQGAGVEGVAFSDLPSLVKAALPKEILGKLGSVRWHVTTVKLNMEVEGEVFRLKGKGAQRVTLPKSDQ